MLGLDSSKFTQDYIISLVIGFGSNFVFAMIFLLVGFFIAKFCRYALRKTLLKAKVETMLTNFLARITFYALIILVLITALSKIGVPTASLIGVASAAIFAISFSLRDSLKHLASGMILAATRPYKNGDFIDLNKSTSGTVQRITFFYTELLTTENQKVTIPNGVVFQGTIINYSAEDNRRMDVIIGIGYEDDIDKARSVLKEVLETHEKVLNDPEPIVVVSNLGDSSVDILLRYWTLRPDAVKTKWEILELSKNALDKNNINIPFPQRDVHLYQQIIDNKNIS